MENSKFMEIGLLYQEFLENYFANYPSGTCYLSGYCLSECFKKMGYEAKSVTGSLALIGKNEKYIVYGNLNIPKSRRIGMYHTWCEILIDGEWYILDPSLKYNKVTLKLFGIKLNSKIPDIVFTKDKKTFIWKYIPDDKLVKESDHYLKLASKDFKREVIDILTKTSEQMETR